MYENTVTRCYAVVKEQINSRFLIFRFSIPRNRKSRIGNQKYSSGGDERNRTADNLRARQALSQLSYIPGSVVSYHMSAISFQQLWQLTANNRKPITPLVGLSGFEPEASRLSGVRSNQLSYRPSVSPLVF